MKILFVLPAFRYGGTSTSFENLLELIANKGFEIDVYAIVDEGSAKRRIAEHSQILNSGGNTKDGQSKRGLSFRCLAKIFKDLLSSIGLDIGTFLVRRRARRFDCSGYDAVIGYQEGYATEFVAYSNAKKKIAWIHSMYSRWGDKKTSSIYDKINTIVCVSETAREDMISVYPNCEDRIEVVYNSLNKDRAIALSREYISLPTSGIFRIISVGRIDPVKRFSYIPIIANELKQKGLKFIWTIVGGVADKKEKKALDNRIIKYGLDNTVILKGQLDNPYPEIAASNILVCLSASETFNYTIAEAKVLGVPVISTDFPAAKEFIEDGKTGIIAPIERIAAAIISLKDDVVLYEHIRERAIEASEGWNSIVKEQVKSII